MHLKKELQVLSDGMTADQLTGCSSDNYSMLDNLRDKTAVIGVFLQEYGLDSVIDLSPDFP
jgi:hypothetical protein